MNGDDTSEPENSAPLPESLDYDAWASALRDGRLLGQHCPDCGATSATPRRVCHECQARRLETVALPTEGVVHSETAIEVTPAGFDDEGYRVGIVDLDEAWVFARLAGGSEIGEAVSLAGAFTEGDGPIPVFA